jgi:GntR family transcriptional regulator
MIVIDLQSSVTLDEQIRSAIRELIALGKLREGDALPSVRQLAGDLSVHWNTVARAYRRLQDDGLLAVGKGRGVVVRSPSSATRLDSESRDRLADRLRGVFADARLLGLSTANTRSFVVNELKRWSSQEKHS